MPYLSLKALLLLTFLLASNVALGIPAANEEDKLVWQSGVSHPHLYFNTYHEQGSFNRQHERSDDNDDIPVCSRYTNSAATPATVVHLGMVNCGFSSSPLFADHSSRGPPARV